MSTANTFDYAWDGYTEVEEVPNGTGLGAFDYAWDGQVNAAADAAAGGAGGPFPHYTRRRMAGGMISMGAA